MDSTRTTGTIKNKHSGNPEPKNGDGPTTTNLTAGEFVEGIGETVADVLTGGIYSTVQYSHEAVEKNETALRQIKASSVDKKKQEEAVDDADLELAGEITANVMTMGLYGLVSELAASSSDDDEKEKEKSHKKSTRNDKAKTAFRS